LEVLVEGSIRETGEGLRITARLIDVHTGRLIWSEGYDTAVLGGPQAAAKRISAEVGLRLSQSPTR
jgi:TolB-like protein